MSLRLTAERAGLSPSTLSRWESGACLPRIPELKALLTSLGVGQRSTTRILSSLDAPRAARAVRTSGDNPDLVAPSGGLLLKILRANANLSVYTVGEALGVNASTISRWESGLAHPSPGHLEALMDLLQAPTETRECLAATGVAKLSVNRPPYDEARLSQELQQLEQDLAEQGENLELRLLSMQTKLWWFQDEPGAMPLLHRSIVDYAEFLCARTRYRESSLQAQAAIESGLELYGTVGIRAHRCLARSDVYRWPNPRPHLGLYTLQRCLANSTGDPRIGVLKDMAEYSWLAGRSEEAVDYARRAAIAESQETASKPRENPMLVSC